jgi:DtxR family transcriptional regulator, Mn-dependent transcriptional regulator
MPEEKAPPVEGLPELPPTTESEQMYLITVARATEEGASGPVPVAALAAALGLSVASANEMIRKLAAKGLMEYVPYKGAELTEVGGRVAGRVLRTRRLWATFLAGHLDFNPAEADGLACHLEHVTPAEAAERLAAYLGDPAAGPLGEPIPPATGMVPRRSTVPLTQVPVGSAAEVVSCAVPEEVRGFLASESVVPGVRVTVAGAGSSGVLLEFDGRWVHLASEIAGSIEMSARDQHVVE